ncbi:unnamed protein product, partial [Rotaria sordida]
MFTNNMAYEFYQSQTNVIHRVKCLKYILYRSTKLQKHIVDIYHKYLLRKENSSKKIYNFIYEISKDIICGKRFDGLIDSIQLQTRNLFINFVSNIFKIIINDYGLETLPKLSIEHNNYVLTDIIGEHIVQSYSNDLIRTFCSIVENNFNNNLVQYQQAIEFVSRWLTLLDDNDRQSLNSYTNKYVWYLAHIYTLFEYEQNDLISMYSAFRIINCINSTNSHYNDLFNEENITRSILHETFFFSIFNYLWQNLNELCSNKQDHEIWIYVYTFISKYHPSQKVLSAMKLSDIRNQIDFMTLVYSIFLNDTIIQPLELVSILL